jgi:chromate reductase
VTAKRVAVIVGSLRKASWNRKLAQALIAIAPPSLRMEIVEIGQLPLYDQDPDDEKRPPGAWTAFREQMNAYEAVLFVTPEYNRSVPAPLKNAIDVGSRPYGHSVWNGKPGAVVSASPGAIGGFGANHHLRQSLVFLNVPCLQMPEGYIGEIHKKFDDDGSVKDPGAQKFLQAFITAYAEWVERNAPR